MMRWTSALDKPLVLFPINKTIPVMMKQKNAIPNRTYWTASSVETMPVASTSRTRNDFFSARYAGLYCSSSN